MSYSLTKDIELLRDFIEREERIRVRVFQRSPEELRSKVKDCLLAKRALRNLENFIDANTPSQPPLF